PLPRGLADEQRGRPGAGPRTRRGRQRRREGHPGRHRGGAVMTRPARLAAASAGAMLLLAGCGGSADDGGAEETVSLRVYAAASLQEPFEEIGEMFEASHEGVSVQFNLAGSSTLVGQIRQGAPADVFASANPETMGRLTDAGLTAADPVDFTTNTLMIAVPAGNPAGVEDLSSLTAEDLNLVVCAPEVPCGAATKTV